MSRILVMLLLLVLSGASLGETQNQRNEAAQADFDKVERELHQLYKDIKSRLKEPQRARFEASQERWLEYVEAEVYARATPHIGGLKAIEVDLVTRTELTKVRLSVMRQWLEQFSF